MHLHLHLHLDLHPHLHLLFGDETQRCPMHPHGFFFESRYSTPFRIRRLLLSFYFESCQLIPTLSVGVVVFVGIAAHARKAILPVERIVVAVGIQAPIGVIAVVARIRSRSRVHRIEGEKIVFVPSSFLLFAECRSKGRWQRRIGGARHA